MPGNSPASSLAAFSCSSVSSLSAWFFFDEMNDVPYMALLDEAFGYDPWFDVGVAMDDQPQNMYMHDGGNAHKNHEEKRRPCR
mgnify:CR=1 FL=1